ncbi:MAG: 30S ribosomal protein S6e [Nanoarchaeota archaeon]|nr:30S ribosomal protein S6e [Nanoarchaeota archaeon]
MAEFKLVIGDPKARKCVQKEAKDSTADRFLGLKIGDKITGELIDLPGYEFEITGGSDYCGFPMRRDVSLPRKVIFSYKGVGLSNKKHKPNPKKKGWRTMEGMRIKKTVAGNMIHEKTAQINLKVLKYGREPLIAPEAAPEKKEEATEKKE